MQLQEGMGNGILQRGRGRTNGSVTETEDSDSSSSKRVKRVLRTLYLKRSRIIAGLIMFSIVFVFILISRNAPTPREEIEDKTNAFVEGEISQTSQTKSEDKPIVIRRIPVHVPMKTPEGRRNHFNLLSHVGWKGVMSFDYFLYIYPPQEDLTSSLIVQNGYTDSERVAEIVRVMGGSSRDEFLLEVGAGIGVTSVGVASKGYHVISVEADPQSAALIRSSAALNDLEDNIIVMNLAAAEYGATGTRCLKSSSSTTSSHIEEGQFCDRPTTMSWVDRIVGNKKIHLMTIDVEGYEVRCIDGARKLLSGKNKPKYVLLTLFPNSASVGKFTWKSALQLLFDNGYRFRLRAYDGVPISLPELLDQDLDDGTLEIYSYVE